MMAATFERTRVQLPGAAPAVIVVAADAETGLRGFGEAPLLPGRPGEAALAGAEETAALDLEARLAGVRAVDLLGGARRAEVECTWLVRSLRPAEVAEEVRLAAGRGFQAFKLKSLDGGGMLDQERMGAARWSAGREARLRIDFNGRLDLVHAEQRLRSLAAFGLEFAEQPLPAGSPVESWVALAGETGVALAADESLADRGEAEALLAVGVLPAVKLATAGGPRSALRLLQGSSRGTIGSSMETSIGIAAAVHAACAYGGELLACGLATFDGAEDVASGLLLDGGRLRLPDGPGLGVAIDADALTRYRA